MPTFVGVTSLSLTMQALFLSLLIRAVEVVSVLTSAGTAPSLPNQLWVVNDDGSKEYRQVRWAISALPAEEAMADASAHPAGSTYTVQGFIIGDDTTPQGFPVTAEVRVVAEPAAVPPAIPKAAPLPLDKVQLTGNNRLTQARDMDIDHLLTLNVRQQLYNYRDTYGLSTEGYPVADGWDSPTTKLKGHGSGHYMSAMAMAYASCPDAKKRKRLKANLRTMVDELRRCQERTFVYDRALGRYREARDMAPEEELRQMQGTWADFECYKRDYTHYGYGYLNAIPAQHCVLVEMYRPYNNEQWVWAPYYSVHKQLAGLIDLATYVDDKTIARKALLIAKDMGLWVWNRLHYRTFVDATGTQGERRSRPGNRYEMWNMYIAGEVGGMAESLARLSMMVNDKEDSARLHEAATYFDSPAFFGPLARNIDVIRTRHANQHIPMITGALQAFRAGGGSDYYRIAANFWNLVQGRYRYAMGGVGNGEMFRQPYSQMLSMTGNPDATMNETCCAYNLAKLTKDLNGYTPNDARLMDYYERVLYNQIVGSLRLNDYAVTYQYAVGHDASKPWGNETPQSTCCGGTGAENHVKYQEAAYFVGGDTLWVALYMPTRAEWEEKGVVIEQDCEWPAEHTVIRFSKAKKPFALKLRVPYWATAGFDIRVNGRSLLTTAPQPSSYVTLARRYWSSSDSIEVIMPFTHHIDYGPDKVDGAWYGAHMNGPLVLCADNSGQFIPDYLADSHTTHYFPFGNTGNNKQVDNNEGSGIEDFSESIALARSRKQEQEAWMALEVKVPEYAPWAPHGYARMLAALNALPDQGSLLPAILNSMRPGNLAEPEDLEELNLMLSEAKNKQSAIAEVVNAINYAEMVVKYVRDGSGTQDMIRRAVTQLKNALQNN